MLRLSLILRKRALELFGGGKEVAAVIQYLEFLDCGGKDTHISGGLGIIEIPCSFDTIRRNT